MNTPVQVSHLPSALTEGLNREQLAAVTANNGNMLVLAGAGSGKTKVLTTRIAWLIERGKATEESILAVTFTNKAAKEMKTRIGKLTGHRSKHLWVGTFHGLCNQMLREFAGPIGIPDNFHIIDTDDQKSICKRILKEMNIDDDEVKPAAVADYISKVKEGTYERGGQNPKQRLMDELFDKYTSICDREGAMDFADLMHKTNQALMHNVGGIRDHYNARFTHILVDEFQDTNREQYNWLRYLKAPSAEIFVVGDDDQSIYSFRGADPENMEKFTRNIKEENIIRLEQNYRSTNHILHAANVVIKNNSKRKGKTLRTDATNGLQVNVCEFDNNMRESDYIAIESKRMIDLGLAPENIAVLYRSNHQAMSIEKSLLKQRVPYVIHGGTRFFERQEVKDAVAYLRLALNSYDDTAFMRIVNVPPRGVGKKLVNDLENMFSLSEVETCLMEISSQFMGKGVDSVRGFLGIMERIDIALTGKPLAEAIVDMYEASGLLEFYSKNDDDAARVNHLKEFVSLAKRYMADEAKPGNNTKQNLAEFLSTFTLEDTKEQEEGYGKKAITLMTIHAAKGLEFDKVFLTGVEEGLMPHKNSLEPKQPADHEMTVLADPLAAEDISGVEEERRLMYVAITRARKHLTITSAKERMVFGEWIKSDKSRFIDELPDESIKLIEPPAFLSQDKPPGFKGKVQNSYNGQAKSVKSVGESATLSDLKRATAARPAPAEHLPAVSDVDVSAKKQTMKHRF